MREKFIEMGIMTFIAFVNAVVISYLAIAKFLFKSQIEEPLEEIRTEQAELRKQQDRDRAQIEFRFRELIDAFEDRTEKIKMEHTKDMDRVKDALDSMCKNIHRIAEDNATQTALISSTDKRIDSINNQLIQNKDNLDRLILRLVDGKQL